MNNVKPLKLAVLAILTHCDHYKWSVQGFGVLRLYVEKVGRLHIWDSRLRYPGVSLIHTHSWDLRSTVVSGSLRNTRYTEQDVVGLPYWKQRLVTGYQSHMVSPPEKVKLLNHPREFYVPGEVYRQTANEIHRTDAQDGTITMMERNEDTNGQADVYWPVDEEWGTATPRSATWWEIQQTVELARAILEASL